MTGGEANIARHALHPPRGLEVLLPDLYPLGPTDQDIWQRVGGDLSLLKLNGTGKSNWFSALRALRRGGGGRTIDRRSLIATALDDYRSMASCSLSTREDRTARRANGSCVVR